MGLLGILSMKPGLIKQILIYYCQDAAYEIWLKLAQRFQRLFEKLDDAVDTPDADDGRRITVYTISSPEALGSGELKKKKKKKKKKTFINPSSILLQDDYVILYIVCKLLLLKQL